MAGRVVKVAFGTTPNITQQSPEYSLERVKELMPNFLPDGHTGAKSGTHSFET